MVSKLLSSTAVLVINNGFLFKAAHWLCRFFVQLLGCTIYDCCCILLLLCTPVSSTFLTWFNTEYLHQVCLGIKGVPVKSLPVRSCELAICHIRSTSVLHSVRNKYLGSSPTSSTKVKYYSVRSTSCTQITYHIYEVTCAPD